ncbi:TPA: gas vesicle accessory protein GvpU [Pseudomonas putida]
MKDPFLCSLVEIVHSRPITFGLTLSTPGGVVTGTLISTKEFFEAFADSFAGAWPVEGSDSVREGFAAWGEQRGDVFKSSEDGKDPFIHLKNARYIDGGGALPAKGEGVLWRGKLDEITGFSLGGG